MRFISTAILIIICLPLYAQSNHKIDSLKKILETTDNRGKVLNELATEYNFVNPKESISYSEKALDLSRNANDPETVAKAYWNLAHSHIMTGEYDTGNQYADSAQMLYERLGDNKGIINSRLLRATVHMLNAEYDTALFIYENNLKKALAKDYKRISASIFINIGRIYRTRGDFQESKSNFIEAMKIAPETGDPYLTGNAYYFVGLIYQDLKNYDKAIHNYLESLRIFERNNIKTKIPYALLSLGSASLENKDYYQALKYYNQAMSYYHETNDNWGLNESYSNLGRVYFGLDQLDSAYNYFAKSLELSKKLNEKAAQSNAFNSIGEIHIIQQEYDIALDYLNQALALNREVNNTYMLVNIVYNIGKCHVYMNEVDRGLEILQKGLTIADSMQFPYEGMILHSELSEAYSKKGQFERALSHYRSYSMLNDSLYRLEMHKNLVEVQTKYETEKKENEIVLQKTKLLAQESVIKRQSLQKNFLIGGAILMLVIFALSIYMYGNKLKVKELINRNQKETEQLRSHFFANISHEFRTPLTLITARIDDLTENGGKEYRADLLGMKRNAMRLLQLVNQLLDLSRIDAGNIPLKITHGDIAHFLKALTESFHSLALQKDITFNSQIGAMEGYFDPDQLEKIVVNLISNAFKYTPDGGEICISAQVSDSQELMFTVKDTGIGVSKEEIDHVFDRFYQAGGSETSGSGIGLSLTKELVQLYKGSIEVESEPGTGSCFTVRLPVDRNTMVKLGTEITETLPGEVGVNSTAAIQDAENIPQIQPLILPEGKPTILVVEDNTELRKYMVGLLSCTYQVIEAPDGRIGLDRAIEHQPDIILSDVMMPEMDGIELCNKVKNTIETSHIPFIMLTAKVSDEDKLEGLDVGADDYLTKPFDKKELKARLKNLIVQRKKLIEKFAQSLNPRDIRLNSADEKFMTRAGAIIREHLSDDAFTVEAFSKLIGMSRTQLFRKIRGLTDMSVSEYMRVIRLNQAAEMLKNRTASVSEIAYDVGFNNLSYFTKCFKERFGINPSDYT